MWSSTNHSEKYHAKVCTMIAILSCFPLFGNQPKRALLGARTLDPGQLLSSPEPRFGNASGHRSSGTPDLLRPPLPLLKNLPPSLPPFPSLTGDGPPRAPPRGPLAGPRGVGSVPPHSAPPLHRDSRFEHQESFWRKRRQVNPPSLPHWVRPGARPSPSCPLQGSLPPHHPRLQRHDGRRPRPPRYPLHFPQRDSRCAPSLSGEGPTGSDGPWGAIFLKMPVFLVIS